MFTLKTRADGKLRTLQNIAVTPKLTKTLNQLNMFQFTLPTDRDNVELVRAIQLEDEIILDDGQTYVIKELGRGKNAQVEVTAIQDVRELQEVFVGSIKYEDVYFSKVVKDVIEPNSKYKIVYHGEGARKRDLNIDDINLYDLIQYLQEQYNFDYTIDNVEKILHIYQHLGEYKGAYATEQLNLTELTSQEDSYELYTRIIPYGKDGLTISDINDGKNYIEDFSYSNKILTKVYRNNNITSKEVLLDMGQLQLEMYHKPYRAYTVKIEDLAKAQPDQYSHLDYALGDTIVLLDTMLDTQEKHRIVETVEFLFDPMQNSIQLANKKYTLDQVQKDKNKYIDSLVDNLGEVTNTEQLKPPPAQPDTLPPKPIVKGKGMFATIMLEWTFERWTHITYQLHASKTKGFTPDSSTLIFQGKASSFLHEVKPKETWYYKCRAVNTHQRATDWSDEVGYSTYKIKDGTEYFEELAIGHALIRDIDADKITVGKLKGQYIDAKNLTVTDGNGVKTLEIDSFGNVSINSNNISIKGQEVISGKDVDQKLNDMEIGGANLLRNSEFKEDTAYWYIANKEQEGSWELTTFQGVRCIKFTNIGWWDVSKYFRPQQFNVIKDGMVTVSMNLYMTQGTQLSIDFANQLDWADTKIEVTKLNEWQRVSATSLKGARDTGIATFSLYAGKKGERVSGYFAFPQAEIGTKASGWRAHYLDYTLQLGDIKFAERNLLVNSAEPRQSSDYLLKAYKLGDRKPVDGETVTMIIKGWLGDNKTSFDLYNSGASTFINKLDRSNYLGEERIFKKTFKWKIGDSANSNLRVYASPGNVMEDSYIEWAKLIGGTDGSIVSNDWIPAPEDTQAQIDKMEIGTRNLVLNSNTQLTLTSNQSRDFALIKDPIKLARNKNIVVSYDLNIKDMVSEQENGRVGAEFYIQYEDNTISYHGVWEAIPKGKKINKVFRMFHIGKILDKPIKEIGGLGLYNQRTNGGTCILGRPKVEISDKVSDYSPAMEDIDQQINTVYTTVKEVEQKTTPDAIVSTVKEHKTDGKYTFVTGTVLEQTKDDFEFKFYHRGKPNEIYNSDFSEINRGWTFFADARTTAFVEKSDSYSGEETVGTTSLYLAHYGDNPNYAGTCYAYQRFTPRNPRLTNFTIAGCYHLNNVKVMGQSPYPMAYMYLVVNNTDGTHEYYNHTEILDNPDGYKWKTAQRTFGRINKPIKDIEFYVYKRNTSGELRITNIDFHEGTEQRNWINSGEIYSNTTKIDGEGVLIYHQNGASTRISHEKVEFTASNGSVSLRIKDGGLNFYEHTTKELVGFCKTSVIKDAWMNGITLSTFKQGDYISIGTSDSMAENNWNSTPNIFIGADEGSVTGHTWRKGTNFMNQDVWMRVPVHMGQGYPLYFDVEGTRSAEIVGTYGGHLNIHADNQIGLGICYGEQKKDAIRISETGNAPYFSKVEVWGEFNHYQGSRMMGASFMADIQPRSPQLKAKRKLITDVYAPFSMTEDELHYTHHEPILMNERKMLVELPQLFAENIQNNYHLVIGKESWGDYRITDKTPYYFEIETNVDCFKFTYQIVAKKIEEAKGHLPISSEQYRQSDLAKTEGEEFKFREDSGAIDKSKPMTQPSISDLLHTPIHSKGDGYEVIGGARDPLADIDVVIGDDVSNDSK